MNLKVGDKILQRCNYRTACNGHYSLETIVNVQELYPDGIMWTATCHELRTPIFLEDFERQDVVRVPEGCTKQQIEAIQSILDYEPSI